MNSKLIIDAVAGTAVRLESGFAAEEKKREHRLRLAFAAALAEDPAVAEVRVTPEWRPEMPLWPWSPDGKHKLGGFDVAARNEHQESYSLVVELKWSHWGIVNALDEVIWDAFKLAHATSTLPGVQDGLLVYLAPVKAWQKPARFAQLFGYTVQDSRVLIAEHESIWRWCLAEGSACKPTQLPPYIQTELIAAAPVLVDNEQWELRAAMVRANGDPWIELDETGMPRPAPEPTVMDWPYPQPGPGMEPQSLDDEFVWPTYGEIPDWPSERLRPTDVPSPTATWSEICWFAAHLNGYHRFGDDGLAEVANASVEHWKLHGSIDPSLDLDQLRGCLFFEWRRYHHFGHAPGITDAPYIRTLVEGIRTAVRQ